MIGGSGEKKTLRTVARYADQWNAMGSVEKLRHKVEVLARALRGRRARSRRDRVHRRLQADHSRHRGRGPPGVGGADGAQPHADGRRRDDDTFWVGTPELVAERMIERRELGFHTFLAEMAAPYDDETLERWIGEVKPMVDAA